MIPYRYLTTRQCESEYPVIYHDADQRDKASKYLVLHEVYSRNKNNWKGGDQWRQYRGIITWNPLVFVEQQHWFHTIYCKQFMNMWPERTDEYHAIGKRPYDLCAIYGPPASNDTPIMMARYDVPLALHKSGMRVNAYGAMPSEKRPEYRQGWADIFRGDLPSHQKRDGLSQHKFAIAFENSRDPYYAWGWVTEKIYDCLGCGTIPIYWGAPNITEYVPKELFIDFRDFPDTKDLHAYLKKTPTRLFTKMSRAGLEFFDSIRFDEYLDVFESLPKVQPSTTRHRASQPAMRSPQHGRTPTSRQDIAALDIQTSMPSSSPPLPKPPPIPIEVQQEALSLNLFGGDMNRTSRQELKRFVAMFLHDFAKSEISSLLDDAQRSDIASVAKRYVNTPFDKLHPGVRLKFAKWADNLLAIRGENES